jgi:hypothetical protein
VYHNTKGTTDQWWVQPPQAAEYKQWYNGQQNQYISNTKHDFLRSSNFKLLSHINGNLINDHDSLILNWLRTATVITCPRCQKTLLHHCNRHTFNTKNHLQVTGTNINFPYYGYQFKCQLTDHWNYNNDMEIWNNSILFVSRTLLFSD